MTEEEIEANFKANEETKHKISQEKIEEQKKKASKAEDTKE